MFQERLRKSILRSESRVCAGLDPIFGVCGIYTADDLRRWTFLLIEVIHSRVAAFKFQYAYYEAFGPKGLYIMKEAIEYAKSLGVFTILDAKRSDIGSTLTQYIKTAVSENPESGFGWNADAITINPFLSIESIPEAIGLLKGTSAGIYIVMTPTAGRSDRLERDLIDDLDALTIKMASQISLWVKEVFNEAGDAPIGFVKSAITPNALSEFSEFSHFPLLIPGVGHQGGTLENVTTAVKRNGGTLYSISRGLYPKLSYKNDGWATNLKVNLEKFQF